MFKSIAQFCAKIKLYFIKLTTKTISDNDLRKIYQDQMKKILHKKDMDEMTKWMFILEVFHVFCHDHHESDKTYSKFLCYCEALNLVLAEPYKTKAESEKFNNIYKRMSEANSKGIEKIQKAGEEERFNNSWIQYWNQAQPRPTSGDFKNYLIEKQGLTEEQVDEINVSAIFVDNNITNFDEFFNEIGRVARG